ncbi:MAG: hypothetical protein ICV78_21345 [Tolypothrix sp. Co-bin9]|nr:hypothetical protein [Tolypothrix sp. Co-bin9]
MPYSQFTIDVISETFGFSISDKIGIFTDVPAVGYSTLLAQTLKEYIPLAVAIGTEKSRSELIIAPILFEVKKQRFLDVGIKIF